KRSFPGAHGLRSCKTKFHSSIRPRNSRLAKPSWFTTFPPMSPSQTCRLALAVIAWVMLPPPAAATGTADLEFFEKKVRPILVERCYECHGADKQKGGLRLDHRAGVQQGGDSGPAITPGEPEKSRLARALSWDDPDLQMPPK